MPIGTLYICQKQMHTENQALKHIIDRPTKI